MTNGMKIRFYEARLNKIKARTDAFKSPGAMRKIARKIRNLEAEMASTRKKVTGPF